ncbi:MAG: hypothetical protein C0510_07265 [Erythrobacter sp.]|nr:hypothetical protein [Erythrobacter sp.]
MATPAAAQQSPRDFTLPPPPVEPAQGPVDDSGVVPVAPRTIPAERPAQEPASDGATEAAPATAPASTSASTTPVTPSGGDARTYRDAMQPGTAQPSPALSPATSRPEPAIESPLSEFLSAPGAEERSDAAQASAPPPPLPSADATPGLADSWVAIPVWQWALAGALTLLLGLVLAALVLRRRRIAQQVPTIEPPLANPRAIADGRIDLGQAVEIAVEISGLSRSLMMLSLTCELSIANRSARSLRNLSIHADITSAHRTLPIDRQLALVGTVLPLCATIDRIGPQQSLATRLNLQLPVRELAAFRRGEAIACVPLLRIRVEGPSIDSMVQTHVIGLANGSVPDRLRPVPLHTPPGSYPGAQARALA